MAALKVPMQVSSSVPRRCSASPLPAKHSVGGGALLHLAMSAATSLTVSSPSLSSAPLGESSPT